MSGEISMYICKDFRLKVRGATVHLEQYDKVTLELDDLVIERKGKTMRENYGRFMDGLKGRYDTMDLHRVFQEKRDIKDEILTKLKAKNRITRFDRFMKIFFNRWM